MAPGKSAYLENGKQAVFRLAIIVEEGMIHNKSEDWETFGQAASKAYGSKPVAVVSIIGGTEADKTQLINLLIDVATEISEENKEIGRGRKDGACPLTFEKSGLYAVIPHCTVKTTTSRYGTSEESVGLIFLHSAYVGQNDQLGQQLMKFCLEVSASVAFLHRLDCGLNLKELQKYKYEGQEKNKICPSTVIFLQTPKNGSFNEFQVTSQTVTEVHRYDEISKNGIWDTVCSLKDATLSLRCAIIQDLVPWADEETSVRDLHAFLVKIFDGLDNLRLIKDDIAKTLMTSLQNALDRINLETDGPYHRQGDTGAAAEGRPESQDTGLLSDKREVQGAMSGATGISTAPNLPMSPDFQNQPKDDNARSKEMQGGNLKSSDLVVTANDKDGEYKYSKSAAENDPALSLNPSFKKKTKFNQLDDDGTCIDGGCSACVKDSEDPLHAHRAQEENDSKVDGTELSPKTEVDSYNINEAAGAVQKKDDSINCKRDYREGQQNYNKHRSKSPDPSSFSTTVLQKGSDLENFHETKIVTESVTGGCKPTYSNVAAMGLSSHQESPTLMASRSTCNPDPTAQLPTSWLEKAQSEILNQMVSDGMVTMEIAEAQLRKHFLQTLALLPTFAMNPDQLKAKIDTALGQWTSANTGLLTEKDAIKLQTTFKSMKRVLHDIFDYYQEYRTEFETFLLHSPQPLWADLKDAKRKMESKLSHRRPDLRSISKQSSVIENAIDKSIDWMWTEETTRREHVAKVEELVAKRARCHASDSLNEDIKLLLARGAYSYSTMDSICQALHAGYLKSFNQEETFSKSPYFKNEETVLRTSILAATNEAKRLNQLKSEKSTKDAKSERKRNTTSSSARTGIQTVESNPTPTLDNASGSTCGKTEPRCPKDDTVSSEALLKQRGSISCQTETTTNLKSSVVASQAPLVPEPMESNDLEELANVVKELETILPGVNGPVARKARAKVEEAKLLLAGGDCGVHKVQALVQFIQSLIEKLSH